MDIVLIADAFPPMQNSAAIQLRDLSREFLQQGHHLTVILPAANLKTLWSMEEKDGLQILRLRAPATKDISYIRRSVSEILMPFVMKRRFSVSPLLNKKWDGVVWYSPSIFHGYFVNFIKEKSKCKAYLILRDIFPEWAADIGLLKRGLFYKFFSAIARYQYSVANIIGVQTKGNLSYFTNSKLRTDAKIEVLQNWLGYSKPLNCSIQISQTNLAGRKVFVYAGNMGVAQGMNILIDLAERFKTRIDIGFLFVGRGSEISKLKTSSQQRKLSNVAFFDEIDADEIPNLYAQCIAGIVSLHHEHKSHNIPGKFLTYIQNGLPVLANINIGNDLATIIRNEEIGQVSELNKIEDLVMQTENLLNQIDTDNNLPIRCRSLFESNFSSEQAVLQIIEGLGA